MSQPPAKALFEDPADAALAEAAAQGGIDRARELVAEGANVNAVGRDGVTPLLWALSARNKLGVEALLQLGADPNFVVLEGFSALSAAAGFDDPEFLRLMLGHGGNPNLTSGVAETLLHTAITSERWANVEMLLAYGADINARNANGMTPILLCAYLDDYQQVAYFLRNGADYTLASDNGATLANQIEASRLDPESEAGEWLQRVRSMLVDRGGRFPAATPAQVQSRLSGPQ